MKLLSLAVMLVRRGGVASSPSSVRTVHSKSVIPRGRAGIRVSQGRRKHRTTSKILKALASKHKWPYHSDGDATAAVDTEEQQLRKAAADWPSWLPKPKDYIAAEQRQKIEEEQQQTRKAAQSHSKPPTVEAVFIPKSSPEHSSRRKPPGDGSWSNAFSPWGKRRGFSTLQARSSAASASGPVTRQLPDWPAWLPPRSTAAPFDRDFHLFTQFFRRHRVAILGFGLVFGGAYCVLNYRKDPLTDRWRFLDVSDARLQENAQDALSSIAFRYGDKLLDDQHSYTQRAVNIANRVIAAAVNLDDLDLKGALKRATIGSEGDGDDDGRSRSAAASYIRDLIKDAKLGIVVVEEAEATAFTTASGFVVFGSSIFKLMGAGADAPDSQWEEGADDRIAAIMAHEISHHLCQHIREQMSVTRLQSAIACVFAAIWSPQVLALEGPAHYAITLPYSRSHEHEADALGLKLMAKAGFDPTEAVNAFERLHVVLDLSRDLKRSGEWEYDFNNDEDGEVFGQGGVPAFLLTHPSGPERLQRLRADLPAALEIRKRAGYPDLDSVRGSRRAASATGKDAGASSQAASQISSEFEPPQDAVQATEVSL